MTCTRSPTRKRDSTFFNFAHLAGKLGGGDDAALDQRLRERNHPALVVAHLVVSLRRQHLDVLAPLVDRDALAAHQHGQRVHPPFPFGVIMLGRLDLAGGQPAHVVVAPLDHAIHSETGALASCSGWHTMSTRVGSLKEIASLKSLPSAAGCVTRQLLTPKAEATAA